MRKCVGGFATKRKSQLCDSLTSYSSFSLRRKSLPLFVQERRVHGTYVPVPAHCSAWFNGSTEGSRQIRSYTPPLRASSSLARPGTVPHTSPSTVYGYPMPILFFIHPRTNVVVQLVVSAVGEVVNPGAFSSGSASHRFSVLALLPPTIHNHVPKTVFGQIITDAFVKTLL